MFENANANHILAAFMRGDSRTYFELIEKVPINVCDDRGANLLQLAIAYDSTESATDLVDRGIDLNHVGDLGMTALQCAIVSKRNVIANLLVKRGADVHQRDHHGNNALWYAVLNSRGNHELVELILEKGGDPRNSNLANRSPIDLAKQIGDTLLAEKLASVE